MRVKGRKKLFNDFYFRNSTQFINLMPLRGLLGGEPAKQGGTGTKRESRQQKAGGDGGGGEFARLFFHFVNRNILFCGIV